MPTKKKTKVKDVVVDRKFLMRLANDIYNPKTRKFLRLCNGNLQNGPDPSNPKRPMHCGLGELYFAMTGRQPAEERVHENRVIDLAIERSVFGARVDPRGLLMDKLEGLNVSQNVKSALLDTVDAMDDEEIDPEVEEFRAALAEIPNENDSDDDDGCLDGTCSYETYRRRSQRVAAQFRAAAKLLP